MTRKQSPPLITLSGLTPTSTSAHNMHQTGGDILVKALGPHDWLTVCVAGT